MKLPSKPWWMTDAYDLSGVNDGLDMDDPSLWGPLGPALVGTYLDRKTGEPITSPGWGGDTFMDFYRRRQFTPRRILATRGSTPPAFAWVMRSAKVVCIDIDGKNGGFDHASKLGFLPPTCAEVSQSKNGYHLFYLVDDTWDEAAGFARFRDAIGIVQGVDFRGTGCVFHKPTQRWNSRQLTKLPDHIVTMLEQRQLKRSLVTTNIAKTLELDPGEIAIMHDELIRELNKPIPAGKRNHTLFAIGSQLMQAQVPNWSDLVCDRGVQIGLDEDELDKLVRNITKYGAQ